LFNLRSPRRKTGLVAAAFAALVAGVSLNGIHVMEEVRRVPVQRLAQNIERQVAERPDNVELRLNLARLYAMAYALKAREFDARIQGRNQLAWFGYDPPHIPGPVQEAPSRDHEERAKQDLARAIKAYAGVVARAPENAIARLGYAWSLEQAGEKNKAIAEYRKAIELAWPKDREEEAFWTDPVTVEAAERLTELLHPVADAKEIASLEQKQSVLDQKGRMITPIAVPLTGNADVPPSTTRSTAIFDADGSGLLRRWTWISNDAGWLVHDPEGSGRITSALQWFGNVTFWLFWSNGYEAMAALDDDGDGQLRGHELRHLAIWRDANENGISEAPEVRPLSAYRIVALSCEYEPGDGVSVAARSRKGVTFADGTLRPTYDLILQAVRQPISVTN
jgi:tetratricopeptide (TPR) repeat protein